MTLVTPEFLVSAAAGERYARWKSDLNRAGLKDDSESDQESDVPASRADSQGPVVRSEIENVELAGCWNESQPYSPRTTAIDPVDGDSRFLIEALTAPPQRRDLWSSSEPGNDGQSSVEARDEDEDSFIDDDPNELRPRSIDHLPFKSPLEHPDCYSSSKDRGYIPPAAAIQSLATRVLTPPNSCNSGFSEHKHYAKTVLPQASRPDDITDTVGAIAIDCFGNIAAGSSSGGIGMKHKGRVGPAALVGIGTAVIPIDPEDKEKASVATVTSGTGEHMATTMAAGTCASRLYTSTRKDKKGGSESTDDDSAIRAFVERDFMGMIRIVLRMVNTR